MADISNVQTSDLKDIVESLEALSCKFLYTFTRSYKTNIFSTYPHPCALLNNEEIQLDVQICIGSFELKGHSTGVAALGLGVASKQSLQHRQGGRRKKGSPENWKIGSKKLYIRHRI